MRMWFQEKIVRCVTKNMGCQNQDLDVLVPVPVPVIPIQCRKRTGYKNTESQLQMMLAECVKSVSKP